MSCGERYETKAESDMNTTINIKYIKEKQKSFSQKRLSPATWAKTLLLDETLALVALLHEVGETWHVLVDLGIPAVSIILLYIMIAVIYVLFIRTW